MTTPGGTTSGGSRSFTFIVLGLVGLVVLLAADLITKDWAFTALSRPPLRTPPPACEVDENGFVRQQRTPTDPVVLIGDYLEFRYAENCGAAFGLARTVPLTLRKILFGTAAIVASILLLTMFVRGRGGTLFGWSVPLIVSGAIGNLYDRIDHGYVIDFIRFHVGDSFEYPTFNVADITITIGVGLLLLEGFAERRAHKRTSATKTETAKAS